MTTERTLDLRGRFRNRQLRLTKPREVVVQVLRHTTQHLSAEEVCSQVHEIHPNVGLTTIYRTLDVLEQMGMVVRQNFGDGRSRYELLENPKKSEHHHHLVCTVCCRVIEYDDFMDQEVAFLRKVERALSRRHGFEITGHEIQFHGLCGECRTPA